MVCTWSSPAGRAIRLKVQRLERCALGAAQSLSFTVLSSEVCVQGSGFRAVWTWSSPAGRAAAAGGVPPGPAVQPGAGSEPQRRQGPWLTARFVRTPAPRRPPVPPTLPIGFRAGEYR